MVCFSVKKNYFNSGKLVSHLSYRNVFVGNLVKIRSRETFLSGFPTSNSWETKIFPIAKQHRTYLWAKNEH